MRENLRYRVKSSVPLHGLGSASPDIRRGEATALLRVGTALYPVERTASWVTSSLREKGPAKENFEHAKTCVLRSSVSGGKQIPLRGAPREKAARYDP